MGETHLHWVFDRGEEGEAKVAHVVVDQAVTAVACVELRRALGLGHCEGVWDCCLHLMD